MVCLKTQKKAKIQAKTDTHQHLHTHLDPYRAVAVVPRNLYTLCCFCPFSIPSIAAHTHIILIYSHIYTDTENIDSSSHTGEFKQ